MKNFLLSILIVGSIASMHGCDTGKPTYEIYRIENATEYPIEIASFYHEGGKVGGEMVANESIQLQPLGGNWQSLKNETTDGGSLFYYLGDSIVIGFNQERQNTFTYADLSPDRQLYRFQENYLKEVKDEVTVYTYTFTDEDYDNALPIGD